jgi:hypothetical protein
MTRILAAIGLGLLLAGCAASAGYGGNGYGDSRAGYGDNFGPYDGPQGGHGGVFGG